MGEVRHAVERTGSVVGVLAILGMIGFLLWSAYVTVVKPHTDPTATTKQEAENIENTYITETDDSFFLGIKVFGLKLGVSKSKKADKPVITQKE